MFGDVSTLIPVIDRLRERFAIARVCVVADRGMISAETVAGLEARRLLYILGVRERSDKLVRELVLEDAAPFVPRAARAHALLQDAVAAGADLPHRQAPAGDKADFPQARWGYPRPRVLQLPPAGDEESAGGSYCGVGPLRLGAGDHRRSRFID